MPGPLPAPIDKVTGRTCLHTFVGLLDALPGLERVSLQGLGEPLMAPDLMDMIMGTDRAIGGDAEQHGLATIWNNDVYAELWGGLLDDDPPDVCRVCS